VLADVLGIIGAACLVAGAYLVALPLALFVAGACLLYSAWRLS
jgi:hypothetical protein